MEQVECYLTLFKAWQILTQAHSHTFISKLSHRSTHTSSHRHVYAYKHIHIHNYTHKNTMHIHTYTHSSIHIRVNTHTPSLIGHAPTHMLTHWHTPTYTDTHLTKSLFKSLKFCLHNTMRNKTYFDNLQKCRKCSSRFCSQSAILS